MVILVDNLNSLVILVTLLLCVFCCSVVTVSSVTPWIVAHQAPLSMGFPRQEYWSGLPFPPPGDLADTGIEPKSPVSLALAGVFFTTALDLELCSSG